MLIIRCWYSPVNHLISEGAALLWTGRVKLLPKPAKTTRSCVCLTTMHVGCTVLFFLSLSLLWNQKHLLLNSLRSWAPPCVSLLLIPTCTDILCFLRGPCFISVMFLLKTSCLRLAIEKGLCVLQHQTEILDLQLSIRCYNNCAWRQRFIIPFYTIVYIPTSTVIIVLCYNCVM